MANRHNLRDCLMNHYRLFKKWTQIHQGLSLFFLPLVAIYILTGFGAILGYDAAPAIMTKTIDLNWPSEKSVKYDLIKDFVAKNAIKVPDGEIRHFHSQIIWGSTVGYHVKIFLDDNKPQANIKVYEPNFYFKLLALHKGRGQPYFRWLTILFCFSYGLVYLSGVFMIKPNPKGLAKALIAGGAGAVVLGLFVSLSNF